MVSDERASPVSAFTPSIDATAPTHPNDGRATPVDVQTASFDVGGNLTAWGLGEPADDLSNVRVCPGSMTFVGTTLQWFDDTYVIDPETLDCWTDGTARLLALSPASRPGERADYRAPFLMDIEGRAALAFESVVTEHGVAHRLLIMGQGGRVAALAASTEMLTDLIAAARGTVSFARERQMTGR